MHYNQESNTEEKSSHTYLDIFSKLKVNNIDLFFDSLQFITLEPELQ